MLLILGAAMMNGSVPLPAVPQPSAPVPPDVGLAGLPIAPLKRLEIMSEDEWEAFVLEWAQSLKSTYVEVRKRGAGGDLGVDVQAFVVSGGEWDAFQCKHYDEQLAPHHVYLELGKLCFYSHRGDYTVPRKYYFVAPRGIGNKLDRLLKRPEDLRAELIAHWDKDCAKKITSTGEVRLEGDLLAWVAAFDFTRVGSIQPLDLIEQHRTTPHYVARFGGGLPLRPPVPDPPDALSPNEAGYVRALLDAYEERLSVSIAEAGQIPDAELAAHFVRSRREFYHAESLLAFSRENVSEGTYDALLDDVHDGIVDVVEASHKDGVERVQKTVAHAKLLPLDSNVLKDRLRPSDKGGMCHQLANEKRVQWKR